MFMHTKYLKYPNITTEKIFFSIFFCAFWLLHVGQKACRVQKICRIVKEEIMLGNIEIDRIICRTCSERKWWIYML